MADERLYRLEPLDASGVFLGLGAVQCALLGTGMLLAVLAISAGLPVPVAAVPVVAGAVGSFARVRGHLAWEWLPLGAGWVWASLGRGRRWVAPLPLWPTDMERPPPLPPCLAGLDVVEVPWRPGVELGAVRDQQTLTALVPVPGGPKFVVEAGHEQERLLAGWGEVLSQFATEQSAVTHVGWSDLARPSRLAQHLAWLPDDPQGDLVPAAQASYRELLEVSAMTAMTHDVVVSITVSRDRLGRRDGPGTPQDRLGHALGSAVDALLRGLRSAGVEPEAPLDPAGLHRLLRIRVDPTIGLYPGQGRLAERLGLATPSAAGPLIVETSWRSVRIDAAWHRTWWVASWPRLAVPASWLEPFLSAGGEVARTMTVTMQPVPMRQSRRRIERDLVKLESDAATKEEHGRRIDARHQRATETLLEREQELVAGYAEMAYVGLVSIAATSEDDLEDHAQIVEQLAHESGMDLRVLDGRQDVAWAAALPLGLAPRSLLAG